MKKWILISSLALSSGAIFAQPNNWLGGVQSIEYPGYGSWMEPANWSLGVPVSGQIVHIGVGTYQPIIYGPGVAETGNLQIHNGVELHLAPFGYLTVDGVTSDLPSGKLIIHSDAAGHSGSFIDNGTVAGNGSFEFHRDMGTSFPDADFQGWHLISSPVEDFSSDDIWDYYLEWFSEPASQYIHVAGTEPCVPAPTYTMSLGQGWAVKFSESYGGPPYNCPGGTGTTIEFTGAISSLYTDDLDLPYTATGSDPMHWNLLGNPYPSSIDANLTGWGSAIQTFSGLGFLPWAGGVGFNIIAPTQGFFVNAFTSGVFTVDNTMRVHGGTFQKKDIPDVVELKSSGNGLFDYCFIRFLDEATAGLDPVWDAPKLMSGAPEFPQIYTMNGDQKFSIDARPGTIMVQMEFIAGVPGNYSIEAIETSEFVWLYLEDAMNGQITDLLMNSYTFTYSDVNEVHPFIVHFTDLGTEEHSEKIINVWSKDQQIYVQSEETGGSLTVFNTLGQEIAQADLHSGLNVIPAGISHSCCIVTISGDNFVTTRKIFVE